uniref:Uncharacterized protein n=1 Tax=Rhizophora mucronata TaxID=61149 RepID=A0A2P2R589_RHIMU
MEREVFQWKADYHKSLECEVIKRQRERWKRRNIEKVREGDRGDSHFRTPTSLCCLSRS